MVWISGFPFWLARPAANIDYTEFPKRPGFRDALTYGAVHRSVDTFSDWAQPSVSSTTLDFGYRGRDVCLRKAPQEPAMPAYRSFPCVFPGRSNSSTTAIS